MASVLYVYRRPANGDVFYGVPNDDITDEQWASFTLSQKRIVREAMSDDQRVWVHIDDADETEAERLAREAAEAAAREAAKRAARYIRGWDFDDLKATMDAAPTAEELTQMQADVAAVADVPAQVDALSTQVAAKADASAVTAVDAKATRAAERVVDVEAFFATVSGRTAQWQAAIDTAQASGGGKVVTRTPSHTFTGGLTLKDGVYLEGPGSGAVTLDFSGMTSPVNSAALYGTGSTTALPALASSIAQYARTITFAADPGVAAGDVLVISDSANGSFNPARTYYRAGEFVRVKSVSGNTVTLTGATFAAYASGGTVSVHKLTPIRTGISGVRMTFTPGSAGIHVALGSNLAFDDLILRGTDVSHLMLTRCYEVALRGINAVNALPETGENYGVTIANCQAVDLDGCFLDTTRHGLTVTGGDYTVGSLPNRQITVRGGRIAGHSTGANIMGCNMHGNVEHVQFLDVEMPHGVTIAGDHTSVRGRLRTGPTGKAVHLTEPLGWNHRLDVEVEATAPHELNQGIIYLEGTSNLTRTEGRLRIRATIAAGAHGAVSGLTYATYVYNNGGAAANDVDLDLDVRSSLPDLGPNALAAHVRAATGGGFRDVRLTVRARRMGVLVSCSPRTLTVEGSHLIEPPDAGIKAAAITSPVYTATTIRSRRNVVERAGLTGIDLGGSGIATGRIVSEGDEATDCYRKATGGSSFTGSSIYLHDTGLCLYRNAVVGDTQGTPTQIRRDAVNAVTTLHEIDITDVGTVATRNRGTITNPIVFRGRGAGAPTFAAAVGSQYSRTDGGASTTLYVNETGTTTWRAV